METVWTVFADWLRALTSIFPRLRIVLANERGVRYRGGKEVLVVEPGIRVYWPLVTELITVCVARQSLDLPPQALEVRSKDGTLTVLAGATIVFRIVDVVKYLVENWDSDQNVAECCSAALRQSLHYARFEDLMDPDNRESIDDSVRLAVVEDLEKFGIEVESVRLTNLCRARSLALANVGKATVGSHNAVLAQAGMLS